MSGEYASKIALDIDEAIAELVVAKEWLEDADDDESTLKAVDDSIGQVECVQGSLDTILRQLNPHAPRQLYAQRVTGTLLRRQRDAIVIAGVAGHTFKASAVSWITGKTTGETWFHCSTCKGSTLIDKKGVVWFTNCPNRKLIPVAGMRAYDAEGTDQHGTD